MDETFAPPGTAWHRVSTRLSTIRRAVAGVVVLVVAALIGVLLGSLVSWVWLLPVAVLAGLGWLWWAWVLGRQTRAWGYAERAEDLLIVHGVQWRRLVVVPYGRMQFVDVTSGPIMRMAGLVTVQLHTASPATNAHIPGLAPQEATRLREQLARRGEQLAAGL